MSISLSFETKEALFTALRINKRYAWHDRLLHLMLILRPVWNLTRFVALVNCSVASPKFWEEPNILSLSEQQYLTWDTASRSTRQQYLLEILGSHGPFGPPGYAYVY